MTKKCSNAKAIRAYNSILRAILEYIVAMLLEIIPYSAIRWSSIPLLNLVAKHVKADSGILVRNNCAGNLINRDILGAHYAF